MTNLEWVNKTLTTILLLSAILIVAFGFYHLAQLRVLYNSQLWQNAVAQAVQKNTQDLDAMKKRLDAKAGVPPAAEPEPVAP